MHITKVGSVRGRKHGPSPKNKWKYNLKSTLGKKKAPDPSSFAIWSYQNEGLGISYVAEMVLAH